VGRVPSGRYCAVTLLALGVECIKEGVRKEGAGSMRWRFGRRRVFGGGSAVWLESGPWSFSCADSEKAREDF
jgi:hypothetical protein